jgi:phage N-6-adenine-methyltransferase
MTLVGFKAQNHRQQVAKRGPRPEVDNLETPWEFFTPLARRFGFTLDVAALPHNAKCNRFFTPAQDGLAQSWRGERVWCNPPYSHIEPWIIKAREEWKTGAELIVMLLPANRTEQGWWQDWVEPYLRERDEWFRVEFLRGRLRFIKHGHDHVEPNQRPPFGCCLLIWGVADGGLAAPAGPVNTSQGA